MVNARKRDIPQLFNPAVEGISQAMSIRMNQMVYDRARAGRDTIVLSLGEAFFDIPLFDFREIDWVKGYHYSDSRGIPELREKIASYYRNQYGVQADPESEILISSGSKALLYMTVLAILQPGEEVLLHEPAWLSYTEQVRLAGGRSRFIANQTPVGRFADSFTPRTRVLILNNPNNPAGRVYTPNELAGLYEDCSERGIYLVVDEAYSDFVLDESFGSVGALHPEKRHLVVVNSLSKNMGMSGWRIGYAIGHRDFIQVLLKINQHVITCAPTILQLYCAHYFDEILKHTLPQVQRVVEKRKRVAVMLRDLGMSALPGGATFYYFVNIDPYQASSLDFALELLQRFGVAVVPGFAYGQSVDRFVRVGVGTESDERIHAGLQRLHELMTSPASGILATSEQSLEAMGDESV